MEKSKTKKVISMATTSVIVGNILIPSAVSAEEAISESISEIPINIEENDKIQQDNDLPSENLQEESEINQQEENLEKIDDLETENSTIKEKESQKTVEESAKDLIKYYQSNRDLMSYEDILGLELLGEKIEDYNVNKIHINASGISESSNTLNHAITILGLVALGENPRDYKGKDLVELLEAKQNYTGGFNDDGPNKKSTSASIIALETVKSKKYDKQKAVDFILEKQKEDGSINYDLGGSVDAFKAFNKLDESSKIKEAKDKIINYLISTIKSNDGEELDNTEKLEVYYVLNQCDVEKDIYSHLLQEVIDSQREDGGFALYPDYSNPFGITNYTASYVFAKELTGKDIYDELDKKYAKIDISNDISKIPESMESAIKYLETESSFGVAQWYEMLGLYAGEADWSKFEKKTSFYDNINKINEGSSEEVIAQAILGLVADGKDPSNYEGKDLINILKNKQKDDGSFGNAIKTGYSILALQVTNTNFNKDSAIQYLLNNQHENGYIMDYFGDADNEATTISLIALSQMRESSNIEKFKNKAIDYILSIKNDISKAGRPTNDLSLSILALAANKIDKSQYADLVDTLLKQQKKTSSMAGSFYRTIQEDTYSIDNNHEADSYIIDFASGATCYALMALNSVDKNVNFLERLNQDYEELTGKKEPITIDESIERVKNYYNKNNLLKEWGSIVGLSSLGVDIYNSDLSAVMFGSSLKNITADSDSTDIANSVLGIIGLNENPKDYHNKNFVKLLKNRQKEDGSFEGSSIDSTLNAIIALEITDESYNRDLAKSYILDNINDDKNINNDYYSSALAITALSFFEGEDVSLAREDIIKYLIENKEEIKGDIRLSNTVVLSLNINNVEYSNYESIVEYMQNTQLDDGSYPIKDRDNETNIEATYSSMMTLASIKNNKNVYNYLDDKYTGSDNQEHEEIRTPQKSISRVINVYKNISKINRSTEEILGLYYSNEDLNKYKKNEFSKDSVNASTLAKKDALNILELVATGKDPKAYKGKQNALIKSNRTTNWVDILEKKQDSNGSFMKEDKEIISQVLPILALEVSNSNYDSESALNKLIENQNSDGSFGNKNENKITTTGQALTALSLFKDNSKVKSAIDKSVKYLETVKMDNSTVLASAIHGLDSVGVKIEESKWSDKLNQLIGYQIVDGSFEGRFSYNNPTSFFSEEGTSKALIALQSVISDKNIYEKLREDYTKIDSERVISLDEAINNTLDHYKKEKEISSLEAVSLFSANQDLSNYDTTKLDKSVINDKSKLSDDYINVASIIANGDNPKNYEGTNLVKIIASKQNADGSFGKSIEDTAHGTLALEISNGNYNKDQAIDYIIKSQEENGGFSRPSILSIFKSDDSDVVTTAIAINALATATSEKSTNSINKAIEYLDKVQLEDGSFESKLSSTSMVISALTNAGLNSDHERWNNIIDEAISYQDKLDNKGQFKEEKHDVNINDRSTALALLSLSEFKNSKSVVDKLNEKYTKYEEENTDASLETALDRTSKYYKANYPNNKNSEIDYRAAMSMYLLSEDLSQFKMSEVSSNSIHKYSSINLDQVNVINAMMQGYDPKNIDGVNWMEIISEKQEPETGRFSYKLQGGGVSGEAGVNSHAIAMILMEITNTPYDDEKALDYLLKHQSSEGGFGAGQKADDYETGLSLIAISFLEGRFDLEHEKQNAISYFKSRQLQNGMFGYSTFDTGNVATSLIAAGEDISSSKWKDIPNKLINLQIKTGDNAGLFKPDESDESIRMYDTYTAGLALAEVKESKSIYHRLYEEYNDSKLDRKPIIYAIDKMFKVGDKLDLISNVTASDVEDGNITDKIITEHNIPVDSEGNITQAGEYDVIYKVTDSANNTTTKYIKVTIEEYSNEAPVIKVKDINLKIGDKLDLSRYAVAMDKEDGDITNSIKITQSKEIPVDKDGRVTTAGEYEVTYSVEDSSNNRSEVTVVLVVYSKENQAPRIIAKDIEGRVGIPLDILKNVYADDFEDGDLTSDIKISKNTIKMDENNRPTEKGNYEIVYEVTDSGSAKTTKVVNVEILGEDEDDSDRVVHIPDKNLKRVLEYMIKSDKITRGDLRKLDVLSLEQQGVYDLTGLEYATNLRGLSLRFCTELDNINVLSNMSNLMVLYLDFTSVDNLKPIKELDKMGVLTMYASNVSDISPLENMVNMEELNIRLCRGINNIEAVKNMKKLSVLSASRNKIKDISALSNLNNLEYISLEDNKIEDISSLSENINLKKLYLNNNNIEDISALEHMNNLVEVEIAKNNIKDISALGNKESINKLDFSENNVTDISVLGNISSYNGKNQTYKLDNAKVNYGEDYELVLGKDTKVIKGKNGDILDPIGCSPGNMVENNTKYVIKNITNSTSSKLRFEEGNGSSLFSVTMMQDINLSSTVINNAPTIKSNGDINITIGEAVEIPKYVTVHDIEDGDNVKLVYNLPGELKDGIANKVGTYKVDVIAVDTQGASSTATVKINVNPKMEEINEAPTIQATDELNINVGKKFNIEKYVSANDKEDGKDIELKYNLPDELSSGVAKKIGTYNVEVKAIDSKGASAKTNVSINVQEKETDIKGVYIEEIQDNYEPLSVKAKTVEGLKLLLKDITSKHNIKSIETREDGNFKIYRLYVGNEDKYIDVKIENTKEFTDILDEIISNMNPDEENKPGDEENKPGIDEETDKDDEPSIDDKPSKNDKPSTNDEVDKENNSKDDGNANKNNPITSDSSILGYMLGFIGSLGGISILSKRRKK
ncbi:hypothetical protein CHL78_007645 [Romboutsia weinsteinii]|uniref:Prenyltransferase alpha-alpha toroid domain-containing protein n=1 Tax=Romboutsia weinsteinii TaxID=2020949 RepID=A0A371J5A6_9FIRM|nr:prenyltransferase/squalene oxidase repeat-containing protein [Romboutsia weinsteinii]RDY27868.1 hypothetical protein CHL78_007645 [Romboutsia weinsteinii]